MQIINSNNYDMDLLKEISNAIWIWFKKYYTYPNKESSWVEIIQAGETIVKRFNAPLAIDLYNTYLMELERHIKGGAKCQSK